MYGGEQGTKIYNLQEKFLNKPTGFTEGEDNVEETNSGIVSDGRAFIFGSACTCDGNFFALQTGS